MGKYTRDEARLDVLRPIAIKIQNAVYTSVQNFQGTITALIDISTGKDYYLDKNGNPVPKNSEESHLYPKQ